MNELLSNLVDNALAHTKPGGNVILRVSAPAVLEVEDDGPGIPLEERDRVFERFYRRNPMSPVPAWAWRSSAKSAAPIWHRSACTTARRRD